MAAKKGGGIRAFSLSGCHGRAVLGSRGDGVGAEIVRQVPAEAPFPTQGGRRLDGAEPKPSGRGLVHGPFATLTRKLTSIPDLAVRVHLEGLLVFQLMFPAM